MITCPECKSEDVELSSDDSFVIDTMPPIYPRGADCRACGCAWVECVSYSVSDPVRRWQEVRKHGNQRRDKE